MSQKYSEGIPLYRQEKQLERMRITLSRQTMANWMMYGANTWLTDLYAYMYRKLLQEGIAYAVENLTKHLNHCRKIYKIPNNHVPQKLVCNSVIDYLWLIKNQ